MYQRIIDMSSFEEELDKTIEYIENYAVSGSSEGFEWYDESKAKAKATILKAHERALVEAEIEGLEAQKSLLNDIIKGYSNNPTNSSIYINKSIRVESRINELQATLQSKSKEE